MRAFSTSDSIDRLSPTSKPSGHSVMRQRWAHLLFLHWVVPVEAIRSLIPPDLEIDTFEGNAYIGLVPFTMTGIRPTWAPPVWGLSSFHEVNVRTYVHKDGKDPGVWFFSLDAANALAVWGARTFWHLPYYHARMRLAVDRSSGIIEYSSDRFGSERAGCTLKYRPTGRPKASTPGSLEHFLAERYILYTNGGSKLLSGRVHHTPYPLQTAEILGLDESLIAANGIARPDFEPLAHYASEVRVRIFPLRSLEAE